MLRNIFIVYSKEILDTIRDRRTIISMIVMPILVFPILTLGFSSFAAGIIEKTQQEKQLIAFIGKEEAPELYAVFDSSSGVELSGEMNNSVDSIQKAILDKTIRAAIVVDSNFQDKINRFENTSITVYFDGAETKSQFAVDKVKDIITEYEKAVLERRLSEKNIPSDFIHPFATNTNNVASKEKMGGFVLSMFLPYIIVILGVVGAMYTAIDLTAGEKERGTLETILVSPIPRWQLASGKFLTILTTSLVSSILAITSMTITMIYGVVAAGKMADKLALKITPEMIFVILFLMVPTACLFSALLMSISIFAKSYKEAQSYASPLMMVVILPALVSFIPGVELDLKLAFVPLVNVCLSIKEALLGNINWLYIMIIFVSALLYAAFAIFVTHRIFEKESVLFRS